jgi:hypothetical protein
MLLAAALACGGGDRQDASANTPSGAAAPTTAGAPPSGIATDGGAARGGATDGGTAATEPGAAASQLTFGVTLYFADAQGKLQPQARDIPWGGQPAELARRVVQALIDGPDEGSAGSSGASSGGIGGGGGRGAALTAVMPANAALLEVYLGDDGTAYVDFDAAFARGLSAGSEDLLLAVWSITESLAANLPQVRRVKILVDGEEPRELGGHLDLSRPLVPRLAAR